ncbi:MAG: hypothetical protein M1330_03295 [Armatimonadetes bacterium]|nr:hypothetical protein [Armatimonadota bacterium]
MSNWVTLSWPKWELEQKADDLLRSERREGDSPVYTEKQLARRGRAAIPVEQIEDWVADERRMRYDELRFMLATSRLSGADRLCVDLWLDGYTQHEVAEVMGVKQQAVSRRLRQALKRLWEEGALSFWEFSRRVIYRRPVHSHKYCISRICRRCGEEFLVGLGCGIYCSDRCREAGKHKE